MAINPGMLQNDVEKVRLHVLKKLEGLSPSLTYHCAAHTEDVFEQAIRIGSDEGINDKEMYLLKIAALYHDTGFLRTYKNHEEASCEIFKEDCSMFPHSEQETSSICEMIMATKVPQKPNTLLQKIICDADLDYLGRNDFPVISGQLKNEFLHYGIVASEDQWIVIQNRFLASHEYHTATSKLLRFPGKVKNVSQIAG